MLRGATKQNENESRCVAQLSDQELRQVLEQRASERPALRAMEALVRLFEGATKKHPALAPGLTMASGLVKLYSQNFCHGNPKHPFADALDVQTLLRGNLKPRLVAEPKPPGLPSKRSVAIEAIKATVLPEFGAKDIRVDGLRYEDCADALLCCVRQGLIERVAVGRYRKLGRGIVAEMETSCEQQDSQTPAPPMHGGHETEPHMPRNTAVD